MSQQQEDRKAAIVVIGENSPRHGNVPDTSAEIKFHARSMPRTYTYVYATNKQSSFSKTSDSSWWRSAYSLV